MELTLRDLKTISHDIIDQELDNYGISANVMPITFVEYSESRSLKKQTVLEKISKFIKGHSVGGFYNPSKNNIVIFIDRIKKIKKIDRQIFNLAFVCYHEVRHRIQKEFSQYSYEGFIDFIDKLNIFDYGLSHDSFSYEIGANLYGVKKAKEYMIKNYPDLFESQKEYINLLEQIYYYQYLTYDAGLHVDSSLAVLKIMNKLSNKETSEKDDELHKKIKQFESILKIFINEDFSFKNIDEIIQNEELKKLDKRIVYAVLSSKTFLSSVDLNNLSYNSLLVLSEVLTYTCNLDLKQIKYEEELQKLKTDVLKNRSDRLNLIFKELSNIRYSSYYKNDIIYIRQLFLDNVNKLLLEFNNSKTL